MTCMEIFHNWVENSEGIVCYGTGKRFQRYVEFVKQNSILRDKLLYCVDKDSSKQGSVINIGTKNVSIYSIDYLNNEKDIVLLITNERYDKVLKELRQKRELRGMKFFCFSYLLAEVKEENALKKMLPNRIRLYDEPLIPKTIHYCWFGGKSLSDKYRTWMESWKKYCPDYEIIEWNEENYDITKNKYMFDAYKHGKWGFVPDYARLDIIYKYGGIYLDTDVEVISNLDDLLYQKAFVGFESDKFVNFGSGFGAMKGNELIRELRDEYDKLEFVDEKGKLNTLPSPCIQTEHLKSKGLVTNGEYQIVDGLVIYPEKVLSSKNVYSRKIKTVDYTKSIHHFDATWKDEEQRLFYNEFEEEMSSGIYKNAHGYI